MIPKSNKICPVLFLVEGWCLSERKCWINLLFFSEVNNRGEMKYPNVKSLSRFCSTIKRFPEPLQSMFHQMEMDTLISKSVVSNTFLPSLVKGVYTEAKSQGS